MTAWSKIPLRTEQSSEYARPSSGHRPGVSKLLLPVGEPVCSLFVQTEICWCSYTHCILSVVSLQSRVRWSRCSRKHKPWQGLGYLFGNLQKQNWWPVSEQAAWKVNRSHLHHTRGCFHTKECGWSVQNHVPPPREQRRDRNGGGGGQGASLTTRMWIQLTP